MGPEGEKSILSTYKNDAQGTLCLLPSYHGYNDVENDPDHRIDDEYRSHIVQSRVF